jgi:hypothetical protein
MKKITLTLLSITLFLLVGTLSVSALGETNNPLRADAHAKVVELRENRLENKLIWASNVELRTQIKLKLIDIKNNEIILDESIKTQLTTLTTDLKAKYTALKDTQGDIQALSSGIKALIEAKDWTTLKTTYEAIIAIQLTRNGLLHEINILSTQINSLLP